MHPLHLALREKSGEPICAIGFRHHHFVVPVTLQLRCMTILGVATVIYKQKLSAV